MRRILLLGTILFLALGCARDGHNAVARLDYVLRLDPAEGILVTARFSELRGSRPRLRMFADWGFLRDQADHVVDFQATDADGMAVEFLRSEERGLAVWTPVRDAVCPITVRYRIRPHDPDLSAESTFLSEDRGVVVGYSTFLVPAELSDYLPTVIRVGVHTPPGWPLWSSWTGADGSFQPETVHDLWSSVVATGRFRAVPLQSERASVTVLTEGAWNSQTALTVANRLLPVIGGMVKLFQRPPRGEDLHVLALYRSAPAEGRSRILGVKEENAFLCLATPDRYADLTGITALAAHECLHFYLGGALTAPPEPPYGNAPEMIWFFEGLTEYLSYRIMFEEGVIDAADIERVEAEKRRLIDDRGLHHVTLAQAARSLDRPRVYELVYAKGYLVAELLDRSMALRCGEGALDDVLRSLLEEFDFHRTTKQLDQEDILKALDRRCPGSADLVRTYVMENRPLPAGGGESSE